MTHPLTDEILEKFDGYDHLKSQFLFGEDDMRAATDWQLAQCLDYIRTTQGDNAMVPFMEAMRPTQEDL